MSRAMRLGLLAAAVAVAVVAFLVAKPGDDEDGEQAATTTTAVETTTAETGPAEADPAPVPVAVTLRDHEPTGGVKRIEVSTGERARFTVSSDVADEIHVHGYDLTKAVEAGGKTSFSFPARIEGIFEVESHEAEHAGKDALIARLVVEPS